MGRVNDFFENSDLKTEISPGIKYVELKSRDSVKKENFVDHLMEYTSSLTDIIGDLRDSNKTLKSTFLQIIYRLLAVAEFKDSDSEEHNIRISRYSAFLAGKMGFSTKICQNIIYAAAMHDIGKVGIPDHILLNPHKLSLKEFEIMKTHTLIGGELLKNPDLPILQIAQEIALFHHERWDGRGYPYKLKKEGIPIYGRIVAVVDVFDALMSKRPFKTAYPVEVAYDIMRREREKSFDPDIIDCFLRNIDCVLEIKNEINSEDKVNLADFSLSERDSS